MGCRQSKAISGYSSQQESTLSWLTALGLQQHYSAFSTAGYGNVHSLVGLTRNHLNVIGQSCPGGLPEEHKIVILAAAKQLSFGRSALGITAGQSAFASSAASVQPKLPVEADQQAVAQQAPQRKGTNRLASHGLDSSASSSSSFASDSETYTSLNASRGSTARHVVQQVPNRLASGPDKPAPSHSQLQVLYSQMEADYKRLQDRSAQSSASSHRPPQPLISGISAAAGANRQGKRSPPPVASSPASKDKASAGSGQGPAPVQVAAGTPLSAAGLQQAEATAAGMANRSNQRSNPVGGRGSSAVGADHRVHGAEGALRGAGGRLEGVAASQVGQSKASPGRVQRVSAAAAVKQMRKQKRVLPVEPFVQVFTNFHTHSKNVGSGEAPSNELQAEALCADAPAAQQGCDMQPQLIAAQHQPHSPQQQVPQTLPPPTATTQPASRLPKPPPLVPQTQVEVIQPCHSQHSRHDQASGRQPVGQQQSQALSVASSGLVRNEDQYEVLRLQASLIPRQCHASLMVPSPSPLLPQPQQAAAQPHFVQSVTHSSAFAASGVSWQTPQAVSASQLASQQDSVTVRQNSGHAVTESRQQHRQHSMHHQVNDDGASRANHAPNAVYQQDQGVKVEQEKRYQGQQPGIVAGEGQLYGGPGPMAQQQPYTIAAMHQRHQAEHAVSRTADGASTTESHTVASSSSHYEFSFRHHSSNAALPSPGVASGAGATAAEALRVIRAAKLHRHGPAPPTPAPAPVTRWPAADQGDFVRQQMLHMDAQIRQRVQQLQQRL